MSFLFSFPFYEQIAQDLLKDSFLAQGIFECNRFDNQELHLVLKTPVLDKTCIILGSISPPESNLFSCLILAHTLKKEGARNCIALIPYLAYTRHEHDEVGKSQVTDLIGKLLLNSGVDQIVTIDMHSQAAEDLFPMSIQSLSPAKIFADELRRISFIPDMIVAPDQGALDRAQKVADALDYSIPVSLMYKKRERDELTHLDFKGPVGEKVLIIDDILDTGQTLISAARMLKNMGAKEIIIMISHGLFTGNLWEDLFVLPVERIYCTNTIDPFSQRTKKYPVYCLSINSILKDFLCNRQ